MAADTTPPPQFTLSYAQGDWRADFAVDLPDRPGTLADLAEMVAGHSVNVERLFYERGRDPNRVEVRVSCPQARRVGALLDALCAAGMLTPLPDQEDEPLAITDMSGVLSFKVALAHRPGALAALTAHFRDTGANLIHMRYDQAENPEMAEISAATSGAADVSALLRRLTRAGYHYHVLWRGGEDTDMAEVLGLSEVEAFLFKLRSVLPPERMSALEELFGTSQAMRQALKEFRGAAGASGEALAVSEVFANILRLAAMAQATTHDRFTLRLCGPVRLSERVALYMLTCPEGANSYLLSHGEELTFLDTNFGIYFEDVMAWLARHGFDPARIRAVLATHPDADHAGWAGRLQRIHNARVLMHPEAALVFQCEDRTLGRGPLCGINRPFTRLVNRLSDLEAPLRIDPFEPATGQRGGFPVVGKVTLADLELLALESMGGHAAGQVFFLEPSRGFLFSGDYLLDVSSLSPKDRDALSVHKTLLTSTNADSGVFQVEMGMLKALMRDVEKNVRARGGRAMVFPGHGDFYAVDQAGWEPARKG